MNRHGAPKLPATAARFGPSETSASLDSLKARLDQKAAIPKPDPPKTELKPKDEAESALDTMFARLITGGSTRSCSFRHVYENILIVLVANSICCRVAIPQP
jgi:hypothetical protein